MREPKFKIGDDVAVCTKSLHIVIPKTKVIEIKWQEDWPIYVQKQFKGYRTGWFYEVEGSRFSFAEKALRKIGDDDYTLTEEEEREHERN